MPDKSVELRLILSGIFLMNDFLTNAALFQSVRHSLVTGKKAFFEICP